jgi:cobalt-zinc-cadmium efflux system outer membrane protein
MNWVIFMKLKRAVYVSCAIALLHSAGLVSAQESKSSKNYKHIDLGQCTSQAPATLNLSGILERAMHCSPDLAAYRLEHQLAVADRVIAEQRPNPNLTLGADSINPHPSQSSQGTKKVDSSVRIDQLIELGGKAKYRANAATAAELASQYFLKYAERAVLVGIEQAFYDGLGAQQKEKDLLDIVEMNKKVLDVAKIRYKVGDISQIDLNKIQLDIAKTNNEYQVARSDLARAKASLAKALGYSKSINQSTLATDWPKHDVALPAIPWDKIQSRGDLQALKNRTLAAENSRDLARALKIPDVTVGLQYNHFPVTGSTQNGTINTYMVNLSIPLFVRHQYQGEAMRAEAEYYRARDTQWRGEKDALTQLEYQETELQANQERLNRVLTDVLPGAEQIATAADFAYKKGAIGVLDLIDARRSLRQARTEASQTRADFAKSLSAFKLAIEVDEK